MKTKYFNDAIIGNKQLVASYSKTGELLRMFYSAPDYRQFIEYFDTGVKINDSGFIKLHEDINNTYHQYYTENTNILHTEIKNTYFNLKVLQTDFVPIKQNIIIKRYRFTNENTIPLDVRFLIHSKLLSNENNDVSGKVTSYGMVQYSHDYTVGILSKDIKIASHQINDTNATIGSGIIQDKDYIGMSSDSSICYEIGELQPGETKTIEIYVAIHENKEKYKMDDILLEFDKMRKIEVSKELETTKKYWNKYVKEHDTLELKENTEYDKKIKKMYIRTILLYPLLINETTGGVSASIEIDEGRTFCGRYAYCWPRDAVFITKAFDILAMEKETEKFYKVFCKNTQSKNGMWEQRFYTDGRLAPCWGYQIDETASVIHGVYEHYIKTKDAKFLKDTLKMCEKAVAFLEKYITQILEIPEEKDLVKKQLQEEYKDKLPKIPTSYDLWEMHEGIHLYSLASIFSSYQCMLKIYEIVELEKDATNNRLKQEDRLKQKETLQAQLQRIKDYVVDHMYHETKKSLIRGLHDDTIDISVLGAVIPFSMFSPKEKKVTNTIENINLTLRTYTGGYQRFQNDHYKNGNPWPIATLWMALYYLEIKDNKKAKECLDFVVNSSSPHGFIAEQIDNQTMTPAWVVGLGWSHAMFILVLEKLANRA